MKNILIALAILVAIVMISRDPETATIQELPKTHSIFVLIENGGTVAEPDQDEALNTVYSMLQQLISLNRRKDTRDTQINIVLSATPNRISWSGTPTKLLEEAEVVKELVAFRPTFSDLVMAFEQISTTINLTNPDQISLYWLGSVVHVPFQTTSNEIQIKVPQQIPAELALPYFSERLSTLKLYGVHPDQDDIVLEYMRSIGVISSANDGSLDFQLLGAAQTKGSLDDLL